MQDWIVTRGLKRRVLRRPSEPTGLTGHLGLAPRDSIAVSEQALAYWLLLPARPTQCPGIGSVCLFAGTKVDIPVYRPVSRVPMPKEINHKCA
jgi:hypothetical protein